MGEKTTAHILKSAILLERRGRAFYKKVASQTELPAVREFFDTMAAEEEQHIAILSEQFRSFEEKGAFAPIGSEVGSADVSKTVLTDRMKEEISAADFEAAAISAAMSMEQRAIDLYSERAKSAEDEHERALYTWLSDWEKSHLTWLAEVDQELREQVWNDQSFWPF